MRRVARDFFLGVDSPSSCFVPNLRRIRYSFAVDSFFASTFGSPSRSSLGSRRPRMMRPCRPRWWRPTTWTPESRSEIEIWNGLCCTDNPILERLGAPMETTRRGESRARAPGCTIEPLLHSPKPGNTEITVYCIPSAISVRNEPRAASKVFPASFCSRIDRRWPKTCEFLPFSGRRHPAVTLRTGIVPILC